MEAHRRSGRRPDDPGIFGPNQTQTVQSRQVAVHLLLETPQSPNLTTQTHPVLEHHCTGCNTHTHTHSILTNTLISFSNLYGRHEWADTRHLLPPTGYILNRSTDGVTFPVVVAVNVEGVEQLVVIMGHQVNSTGTRLDDPHHLHTHTHTKNGPT